MKEKKLIELFKDSADKLKRKEKSSTALHSMGGYGEVDIREYVHFVLYLLKIVHYVN